MTNSINSAKAFTKMNLAGASGTPSINNAIGASVANVNHVFGENRNASPLLASAGSGFPFSYSAATAEAQKAMNFGTVGVTGKKVGEGAQLYSTEGANEAARTATRGINGANRLNENGSANPLVNRNFDDFKNYGRHELEGYFGNLDKITNRGNGNTGTTFPPAVMHQMSENSEFKAILAQGGLNEQNIQNLWDRTSQITGAIFEKGTSKFEDAAISTLQKFNEAGLGDLMTRGGVTTHDQAEVLSHAMKNNMSVSGMKDFGGVYGAYLDYRDNVANTGRVTRSMMNEYYQTGTLPQGKDYGIDDGISTNEMRKLAGDIHQKGFDSVLSAMGYDPVEINQQAAEDLNLVGKTNHDPSLLAAIALSNTMGKEDANGQTGWDKLVADSKARDGNPDAKYDANGYISMMHDSTDLKTDGAAFVRSEGGLLGLDALSTMHSGGLRNNPMAPNTLAFGYQGDGSTDAINTIANNIAKARESGIAVNGFDNLTFAPSGHGGQDGGILMKSGRADFDQTSIGLEDTSKIAKLLVDNTKDGGTINIDADACFGGKFAQALHNEVLDYAKDQGKNIRSSYSGSINEGSMLSHSLGESINNGDTRVEMDANGAAQIVKHRGDREGAGNINSGEGYSLGKESFDTAAAKNREEKLDRAENIDKNLVESSRAATGSERSNISEQASSQAWGDSGAVAADFNFVDYEQQASESDKQITENQADVHENVVENNVEANHEEQVTQLEQEQQRQDEESFA